MCLKHEKDYYNNDYEDTKVYKIVEKMDDNTYRGLFYNHYESHSNMSDLRIKEYRCGETYHALMDMWKRNGGFYAYTNEHDALLSMSMICNSHRNLCILEIIASDILGTGISTTCNFDVENEISAVRFETMKIVSEIDLE